MSTYTVSNISRGSVTFDSTTTIRPGGVQLTTIITPELMALLRLNLVSVTPSPSITTSYQLTNKSTSVVYIGSYKLIPGAAVYTDTLTDTMMSGYNAKKLSITPLPGTLAPGGVELDPTVTVPAQNAFGVDGLFKGTGSAVPQVTTADLGDDFDVGALTPAKINIKRMVGSTASGVGTAGLVPAAPITATPLFLNNTGVWSAPVVTRGQNVLTFTGLTAPGVTLSLVAPSASYTIIGTLTPNLGTISAFSVPSAVSVELNGATLVNGVDVNWVSPTSISMVAYSLYPDDVLNVTYPV